MKNIAHLLLTAIGIAMLPLAAAHAQTTKTTAKPAAKPVPRPAAKPVAKPAAKPTTTAPRPAAQPAPATTPPPPTRPAPAVKASAARIGGPFDVGTNALNIGIGLGNRYGYGSALLGGNTSVSPALSISYERGLIPLGPGVLGVGVFGGYQGASYDFGSGYKWKFTDIIVTLRGAFHYPVSQQFDAYGGLNVGLRHAGASIEGSGSSYLKPDSYNELAGGLFVGGRYFFSEAIGAFAELGYDQTYLKVGLTAKF